MTEDDSGEFIYSSAHSVDVPAAVMPPDPDYPHVPHPIIRPAVGSPYYIHPRTGWAVCPARPGTPLMTSEDVRRELEDFP